MVIDVDHVISDEEDTCKRGMQRCRSSANLVRSSASKVSLNVVAGCTSSDVPPVHDGILDAIVLEDMVNPIANSKAGFSDEGILGNGAGNCHSNVGELRSCRAPLSELTNIYGNSTLLAVDTALSEDSKLVRVGSCSAGGDAKRAQGPPGACFQAIPSVQHHAMVYSSDVLRAMLAQERYLSPPAECMANQVDINPRSRSILNNWLIDVHTGYHHRPETLFLSVNIVDRYLAWQQVTRELLQLVGITATLIAAKFEEVRPPDVSELVYITENSYTRRDVLVMECQILSDLQFDVAVPTAAHFLQHFVAERQCCAAAGRTFEAQENLAWHILELSLLDVRMLHFAPSRVAAASLMLSNQLHSYWPAWPKVLSHISGYQDEDLQLCANELRRLLEMTPSPTFDVPLELLRQGESTHTEVITQSGHCSPRRVAGVPASWR